MNNSLSPAIKIIQNSIISSLYIDDKIVEPFEQQTEENKTLFETSKALYSSFKEQQKSLDFYKFSSQRDWTQDVSYLFKNRDLLVLDWQLNDAQGLEQPQTLRILKKAVLTDNLHFVSIYTTTPKEQFSQIFYSIKAFFNPLYTQKNIQICNDIIQQLDSEGIDTAFFKSLSQQFLSLSLERNETKPQIIEDLKNQVQSALSNQYKIFAKLIRQISTDAKKACEIFGYFINNENLIEETGFDSEVSTDYISNGFILVNHTIIQITNKSNPEPKDLFKFFTDAVREVCGNLLTLVSLEVRSLLRESSGFVGKMPILLRMLFCIISLKRRVAFWTC